MLVWLRGLHQRGDCVSARSRELIAAVGWTANAGGRKRQVLAVVTADRGQRRTAIVRMGALTVVRPFFGHHSFAGLGRRLKPGRGGRRHHIE